MDEKIDVLFLKLVLRMRVLFGWLIKQYSPALTWDYQNPTFSNQFRHKALCKSDREFSIWWALPQPSVNFPCLGTN